MLTLVGVLASGRAVRHRYDQQRLLQRPLAGGAEQEGLQDLLVHRGAEGSEAYLFSGCFANRGMRVPPGFIPPAPVSPLVCTMHPSVPLER